MSRIHCYDTARYIGAALERINRTELFPVEFIVGVNPNFAGVHKNKSYTFSDGHVSDYSYLCHTVYRHSQIHRPESDRTNKIVMPAKPLMRKYYGEGKFILKIALHELGHILDYELDFEHIAQPVTKYAQENRYEAFAEAFAAYMMPEYETWRLEYLDEATKSLFDSIGVRDGPI